MHALSDEVVDIYIYKLKEPEYDLRHETFGCINLADSVELDAEKTPLSLNMCQPVTKLPVCEQSSASLRETDAEPAPAKPGDEKHQGRYHPVESAVNMLLARVAFDVLRNPEVKQKLIAHIYRKVNELRFPSYIHGIEVRE